MGRPRDEDCWNEVIKEDDGTLTCRRCRKKFKGGVARIKAHLGKEKGKGIKLCKGRSVLDTEGVNNSIIAGSSNPPEVVNGMNSSEGTHRPIHTRYVLHIAYDIIWVNGFERTSWFRKARKGHYHDYYTFFS